MQKLAVVYFPQTNTDYIDQFREKYDPGCKIIPPHITIVSPVGEISENQLIEHVESVTKDIASFPIHLYGLTRTFDNYLFLQVKEGNEKIIDLHRKLYSGILTPYLPAKFLFEPHITLGFLGIDGELFHEAYAKAEKMNIDLYCNFDTLSLIKGDGSTPAIKLKTFILQKSTS